MNPHDNHHLNPHRGWRHDVNPAAFVVRPVMALCGVESFVVVDSISRTAQAVKTGPSGFASRQTVT